MGERHGVGGVGGFHDDGGGSIGVSGTAGLGGSSSIGGGAGAGACCDSHRLFGEALVLYLKSLSMAKEAIIWGNQALESLSPPLSHHSVASSSVGGPGPGGSAGAGAGAATTTAVPLSPPLSSNAKHLPPGSPLLRGAGVSSSASVLDDTARGMSHPRQAKGGGGVLGGPGGITGPGTLSRLGSGRIDAADGASSSDATEARGGDGSVAAGGAGFSGGSALSSSSSEAQVATWGKALLNWLSGQFSTVLRRAERCRVELRGPVAGESAGTSPAGAEGAQKAVASGDAASHGGSFPMSATRKGVGEVAAFGAQGTTGAANGGSLDTSDGREGKVEPGTR